MGGQLLGLAPFTILAGGSVAVLLAGAWSRRKFIWWCLTALTLAAAAASLALPEFAAELLYVLTWDGRTLGGGILIFTVGAAVLSLSYGQPSLRDILAEEYLTLLLLSLLGMLLLIASRHLMMAFVALELMAVPLYALVAWHRRDLTDLEAGIKYAVMASFAAAFMVFGCGLIYGATGSLLLDQLNAAATDRLLLSLGITFVLLALGFKLAMVPFHMWAPDVYDASPTPVTTLLATAVKASVVLFSIRLFASLPPAMISPLLWGLAVITMTAGNILALRQNNIKRLFAYSSIAHVGYILVAFAAANPPGYQAAYYYAWVYAFMNLGAFAVISYRGGRKLEDYRGLGRQSPWMGICLSVSCLSLLGIPPLAGFMAKLLVFNAALQAGYVVLVLIAVVNTVISVYYYLRIIMVIFSAPSDDTAHTQAANPGASLVAVAAMLLITVAGIFPGIFFI